MRWVRGGLAAGILVSFPIAAEADDMGKAPVPSGSYASFDGGYLLTGGDSAIGHGISSTGLVEGPTSDTTVNARDGWFLGASVGFASSTSLIGGLPFTRAEAFFTYGESDDTYADTVTAPAHTVLKSVDGTALGVIGNTATSAMEQRIAEGGVRLAFDQAAGAGTTISWVVTPFVRNTREDTDTVAVGTADTAWRSAEVKTWGYGVTIAAEPEIWLTEDFALVGRIGGGIYGYDSDANFYSRSTSPAPDPFLAVLAASDSGAGFRGLLGAGVKIRLTAHTILTGFAEADYFSRAPHAVLPDNQLQSAATSGLDTDSAWQFRAGVRVTVGLDGN